MERKEFAGLWTALITPFMEGNGIDNEIDFASLDRLLQNQIDAGVTGVLLLGTTAENPTLTKEEGEKLLRFAVNKLKGKTKIMVNIGTYSTKKSLENIEKYDEIEGIDAYLVVNPYYNKPTQTGLYLHFTTIADSTKKPIFLYNIKGRTGVNLNTDTLIKIIEKSKNVIGVKEASGDINQMKEVIEKTPSDFTVLCGDDGLTYDLIKMGGDGIISVASNCIPQEIKEFVDFCILNDERAKKLNEKHKELFSKLFIQTNPLPTKTYLAYKDIIKEEFRLPMCKMDEKEKNEFLDFIKQNNY
ncbi:MAG: 4-hydroxy-tetrahydrodipicolinate synthase [Candidatus Gracilibacteria bacterium]|nr:4-hydroxy-tetrahydrodipicolinate synthase [Candidatus Gracilibacteria bacterium]